MAQHRRPDAEALLAQAKAGAPGAALAARRAAILAERGAASQDLAREALALAARLEPLDPAPRLALARLHAEAGDLAGARAEASAVLADAVDQAARARAAFMLGEIARFDGETGSARVAYDAVLRIEDSLLAINRNDPHAARWYARARGRIAELDASAGEHGRARTGAEGALAMLRAAAAQIGEPPVLAADIADAEMRLAALELDSEQPASARRRLGEAIGRFEALAVTEKDEPHWRAVLADAWALAAEADYARGAAEPAREAMDKALQARLRLAARHSQEAWALAGTWRLRGALRAALGDAQAAADSFTQARALAEKLCQHAAGAEAPARFLVHTLLDQADHGLRTGELNIAHDAADCARAITESFARGAGPGWFGETAACWDRLGELARASGAPAQARDAFARGVEFRRRAHDSAPDTLSCTRGLAAALVKFGETALDSGANEHARAAFDESVVLRLQLAEAALGDASAAHALAAALERSGLAAQAMGDSAAARAAWEDELALAIRIFADGEALDAIRFRAIVESHLASAGGAHAETHRQSSLARFDTLAKAGALTEREGALRKKLWGR